MNIVVGNGKNRRSFILGHKSTMSRGEFDKCREDLKAFIVRPSTFVGHTRSTVS